MFAFDYSNLTSYKQQAPGQLLEAVRQLDDELRFAGTLPRPGYALAEAHKKLNERDAAHNAARQAISAAASLLSGIWDTYDPTFGLAIAVPVLVTSSPICEAALSHDGKTVLVEQTAVAVVRIKVEGVAESNVIIVNEESLGDVILPALHEFDSIVSSWLADFAVDSNAAPNKDMHVTDYWRQSHGTPKVE